MGGRLAIWGNSIKHFDRLHRSSLPLTVRTGKSLAKINANFLEIYNQNETIAKYIALKAGFGYGVGFEHEDPALIPTKTIIKSLTIPRHLMPADELNFYRSRLKSIIKAENSNLAEIEALARTTRQTLDLLRKIARFYRFTHTQELAARQKAQQKASGVKRAGKSRRRK